MLIKTAKIRLIIQEGKLIPPLMLQFHQDQVKLPQENHHLMKTIIQKTPNFIR